MKDHIAECAVVYAALRDEGDVISGKGASHLPAHFPHAPFRTVAPNCVSKLFPCYKSNTTNMVVLLVVI